MAQAKGRPIDIQRNLRREKEKEGSTRREPSRFELVDRSFEKNKQPPRPSTTIKASSAISQSRNLSSQTSHPQFRRPDTYLSAPTKNRSPPTEAKNRARTKRRLEIEKKEARLLEQRIKEVETEMRNLGASRKDIHEVHSEGVQHFFWKARRWRSEEQENNLLQKIEEEDIRLNEDLCARRMATSHGMDKIWERYDEEFLAEPRNRIHRLDKARFEKWAKETGYTYTPIQIPPSQRLLDNLYQERRASNELYYVSKDDENQYINDVALLRRVTIREQGRVPREDITEEEETSSSESDPEPELNVNENSHPVPISRKLKSKQQTGNKEIVIREHITRSGRVTSVKVPVGLQRDGTQIRKVRDQGQT